MLDLDNKSAEHRAKGDDDSSERKDKDDCGSQGLAACIDLLARRLR
jgi:hypothetical protein